jgi:pyridoxamine 5'-phosphate oxidase
MLQGVTDLSQMRRSYRGAGLEEGDLAATWLEQFRRWLDEAVAGEIAEPNAVILATATPDGRTGARTVLLKAVDVRGFVIYTNLQSRKAGEALGNPRATLVFPWLAMRRQVIADGAVSAVSDQEADAYFASRPRSAQLGAWASPQSTVIADRAFLDDALAAAAARFPPDAPVPRPPHWGGLRIDPDDVEFWCGQANRLHDRLRYHRGDGGWTIQRLAP